MPVGNLSIVCKSNCFSNSFLTFSPAPPSNKTLSGRTTAALPFISRIVLMCCKKFNCLFEVVVQKSGRSYTNDSFSALPSPLNTVILLFLPNGGLVITTLYLLPGSETKLSSAVILASLP